MKTNKILPGHSQHPLDAKLINVADSEAENLTKLHSASIRAIDHHQRAHVRFQNWVVRTSVACGTWLLISSAAFGATFRWSVASNRIYVEGGGSARLSDIKAALPSAPLDLVNVSNKVWLLRADLQVQDGCTLVLRGGAVGGDVNELRLQSVNAATNCTCVVSITADWGTLDIHSTKITSWDTMTGVPDTDPLANGRAYVRVRSTLSTNGITPLESWMNITNSEICYLGTDDSEAYGLVWKVGGVHPNPTNSIFDFVNVYGNVVNSHIHDNYFGLYTYGAEGMKFLTNQIAYNVVYGIDPHDDSDNLLIQGNNVHHNGDHGIIASMRCDHLTIRGNTCWSNAQNGIILHRSSNHGLIEGNQCYNNADSGIALTGSSLSTIRSNLLTRNGTAGVRLDLGSADNVVANNQSISNTLYGFYFYKGSATPEPNDDGRPKRNLFVANLVQGNGSDPIRLSDSDDNTFATNTFTASSSKLRFQRGFRNWLDGNSIPADLPARTEGDGGSSATTYVRNQTYLDVEAGTNATTVVVDAGGRIYEPDEGNILTAVSTDGTSLALASAAIGSSSTVVARNFWAGAAPGTGYVSQVVWAPATRTQWTVAAGAVGQALNFTVGDLIANNNYLVRKANVAFVNLTANASGLLQISDTATTTNPIVYSVETFNTNLATLQYSASLNKIYLKNNGSATLSDIRAALPTAPLSLVDTNNKIWLLSADILVQDGCTLVLRGAAGGDVNELRLLSLNTGETNSVISITADPGALDIKSTKITSWDTAVSGPDTNHLAFGRAYIRVRSTLETNGITPLESRMDIANSEVCFLGSDNSEAYGLVWKVAGTHPNPTNSIFDFVNVYGDVINSRLHDNYNGAYTFGAFGMQWLTNEIDHNVVYGLNLKEDSDQLEIVGNNIHHNGSHGATADARCDHLAFTANLCWTNAKCGILLDESSNDSTLEANQCYDNAESGIALSASAQNDVRGNVLARNQQAGLRLTLGSADNLFENNQCVSNVQYGIYCFLGSGTPNPGDDGRPKRNSFVGNLVYGNGIDPIRIADSDDNTFATNVFTDVSGKLRFQRGLGNWLDGNSLPQTLILRTEGETNASAVTYVRNQSYVKVELSTNGATIFQDVAGRIYQPDEGALQTAVSTNGSSLTLDMAGIGSSTTVAARNFFASAATGTGFVHHLIWTNATSRQWSANAGFAGQTLSFAIGDLIANTNYLVRKAGLAFTNLQSNASGQILFSDHPSSTGTVIYSLDIPSTNNTPPTLPNQVNRTIGELTTLTVTNTAIDLETPPYLLVYGFLFAPSNAVISATGIITWTPTETQGPSTNTFTTVVSDAGSPSLNAINSFTVVVNEVNAPAIPPNQSEQTIAELSTLVVTNTATDPDIPAGQLSYALQNAPTNAAISPQGVITWTPTEAQGPSTTILTTVITDNGVPPRSSTNSFAVMVTEVNTAPSLPGQTNIIIVEGSTLAVTNAASDADLPANQFAYQLTEAPANAVISTNGVITWLAQTDQNAPTTNTFTTVVTDDAISALSATNSFVVVVLPTNTAPVLPVLGNLVVAELTGMVVANTAIDSDIPTDQLAYVLQTAPTNAAISASGIISWTPTEAQGPGTNIFTTVVTDNGTPAKSATNSFTVVVTEMNATPTLASKSDLTIYAGATVMVTNAASDTDIPLNPLSYQLTEAPTGAVISANGVITWTSPFEQDLATTNTFTTVVTDVVASPLSATNTFVVIVNPQPPIALQIRRSPVNGVIISWTTSAPGWMLQSVGDLGSANWADVTNGTLLHVGDDYEMSIPNLSQRAYFRLKLASP